MTRSPLLLTPQRAWNRWWYGPISPAPLGLFRVVFGCLVLTYGLLLLPDRALWFGERGALSTADSDRYNQYFSPGARLDLLHGVTDDRWLTVFFVVFLLAAVALALGLATRLSSVVVLVQLMSLHNRDQMIHNSADMVMVIMAAYLALAPAGAACSLDRVLRRRQGREGVLPPLIAPWAQRLMQLQVAAIYCSASLSKLGSPAWRDGSAVYYALRLPDVARFPVPWIDARHLWLIHALTWGTIAVELSLWTLIWLPRTRLYALAAGVLLHLGIEYALNLPLFAFLMIASYIVFLTDADVRNFRRWAGRGASAPASTSHLADA